MHGDQPSTDWLNDLRVMNMHENNTLWKIIFWMPGSSFGWSRLITSNKFFLLFLGCW